MENTGSCLNQQLEKDQGALIDALQQLLAIPSVRGNPLPGAPHGEGPTAALLCTLRIAGELGFATRNLDGYLGYAEWGQGPEYVAVLSHLDVVPEGDGWTHPPYGGECSDGKIYGRGAMDNKGPAMASLFALKAIRDAGVSLTRRVRILFGTGEETGSEEIPYYLQHEPPPVAGFTPDGWYPLVFAEKGILIGKLVKDLNASVEGESAVLSLSGGQASNIVPDWAQVQVRSPDPNRLIECCRRFAHRRGFQLSAKQEGDHVRVQAVGVAAHGSKPEQGRNAIMAMIAFLAACPTLPEDWRRTVTFLEKKIGLETDGHSLGIALEDPISGKLSFNLGMAQLVDHRLELTINLRWPVTYTYSQVLSLLENGLAGSGFALEELQHQEPLSYPTDHPLVVTLLSVYREQTGRSDPPLAVGGGTYAKEMPNTIAFGPLFPGDPETEHKVDEYITIENLMRNAKLFAGAICALAK